MFLQQVMGVRPHLKWYLGTISNILVYLNSLAFQASPVKDYIYLFLIWDNSYTNIKHLQDIASYSKELKLAKSVSKSISCLYFSDDVSPVSQSFLQCLQKVQAE